LGDQVLRSSTLVGAHYREAMFARSQAEFVNKIKGSLQELEESKHWLQLLVKGGIVAASRLATLRQEAAEITAILIATVNLTNIKSC
jgi:four helix bundle protein